MNLSSIPETHVCKETKQVHILHSPDSSSAAHLRYLPDKEVQPCAILNSINYAVAMFDLKGNLITYNSAAHSIVTRMKGVKGVDADLLIGAFFRSTDVFHSTIEDIRCGGNIEKDMVILDSKNTAIVLETSCSLINGGTGVLLCFRDITDRVYSASEKSNQLKTEFLAQMSHEIRTPVNSILSFASLLKEEMTGKMSEDLYQCFEVIDNGGRRLIRTIDMILNMSQFQSGNYEPAYQNIDLADGFLEKLAEEFMPSAKTRKLNMFIEKHLSNAFVEADIYTLGQIFINIIDNAIKYTPEGEVKIVLYRNAASEICVDVSDTGIGISLEYMPHLFDPFSQEEMGYTRKYEGNGLGLALVKKYLEINRASILVCSRKNEGSTFTIIFRN